MITLGQSLSNQSFKTQISYWCYMANELQILTKWKSLHRTAVHAKRGNLEQRWNFTATTPEPLHAAWEPALRFLPSVLCFSLCCFFLRVYIPNNAEKLLNESSKSERKIWSLFWYGWGKGTWGRTPSWQLMAVAGGGHLSPGVQLLVRFLWSSK